MNRFIIQESSTRPDWWVLTDTENGIVLQFEDGAFNEMQKVTMLEDMPRPDVTILASVMREMGDWAGRYHGSKCFKQPYGFEFDNNEQLYLYRKKTPKWRLKLEDNVDKETLATTLRKAAEFLTKNRTHADT